MLLLPPAILPSLSAGITAFVLGCGFVVAMFFAPIFSSIPGFATGPALVVVGTLMIGHAREIDVSGHCCCECLSYQAIPACQQE
jgi:xanthine/uracil/vitamin C permease (AzgA family)